MTTRGDWFDEEPASIVPAKPSKLAESVDTIRAVEDEIHKESANVLRGVLAFSEVDPAWESPPDDWIAAYGQVEAEKRFRLAKYALMNAKEAPVGLKLAKDTFVGMSKARAAEKGGARTLNMTFVQMSRPMPVFPEKDVEK
jgi:hypothetical protein